MIKVTSYARQPGDPFDTYEVKAFADTKEEVTAGATFVGFPPNGTMAPGSTVDTAKGEQAKLKSDGTWEWVKTIADLGTVTTSGHQIVLN